MSGKVYEDGVAVVAVVDEARIIEDSVDIIVAEDIFGRLGWIAGEILYTPPDQARIGWLSTEVLVTRPGWGQLGWVGAEVLYRAALLREDQDGIQGRFLTRRPGLQGGNLQPDIQGN